MILLDTCLLSEMIRPRPDPGVVRWFDVQDEFRLYMSVLTLGELSYGADRLAPGARRDALHRWIHRDLQNRFEGRLLLVDEAVSKKWGALRAQGQNQGRPLPPVDGLLAATALVHECLLATRNVQDFIHTDVRIVNPWDFASNH